MTQPTPVRANDPQDRLLRQTRVRLAAMTLALVAALLAAVGVVTFVTATRLMDANVGRAMDATLQAALDDPEDHDDDRIRRTPNESDTFVLFLDANGRVLGNPSRVGLPGIPDTAAVAAAATGGDDRRDGTYAGVPVRLLTRPVILDDRDSDDHDDDKAGTVADVRDSAFVQVGFVLSLYRAQQHELLVAIVAAVVMGIVGAGVVTLLVTQRALSPIRTAFAAERRFVAAASHELRTPVAIIRASAEVMQREGHATPSGEPLLADIVAETDRLGRLVGDLLALASAEAGAITIDPRHIELGSWLAETMRRIEPMVRTHGLRLTNEIDRVHGAVVDADPDRLTQLLLVLIDNAVAHSPPGGAIHLAAAHDGTGAVAISVTDQGPGIPEGLREAIFEPFARPRGSRRTQGSGLGLAIARQLATRQGGALGVADTAKHPDAWGSGACFVLRLPLVGVGTVAPDRRITGQAPSG